MPKSEKRSGGTCAAGLGTAARYHYAASSIRMEHLLGRSRNLPQDGLEQRLQRIEALPVGAAAGMFKITPPHFEHCL